MLSVSLGPIVINYGNFFSKQADYYQHLKTKWSLVDINSQFSTNLHKYSQDLFHLTILVASRTSASTWPTSCTLTWPILTPAAWNLSRGRTRWTISSGSSPSSNSHHTLISQSIWNANNTLGSILIKCLPRLDELWFKWLVFAFLQKSTKNIIPEVSFKTG